MISTLLALLPLVAAPADLEVEWTATQALVADRSFDVKIVITAGDEGAEVPVWLFGPAAFEKDGTPLGPRPEGMVSLSSGAKVSLTFDLAAAIGEPSSFTLGFAPDFTKKKPIQVRAFAPYADAATDFMTVPLDDLSKYSVLMETNRGQMVFEMWPDVAPNHVRNFLDLNHRGFYEGVVFHRVSPVFMIQGGDGSTRGGAKSRWTGGGPPRTVLAEFNEKLHVRGVLSAARTPDPNSANSQFFVMTAKNVGLDGKYSAYGKLISGIPALDAIANAEGVVNPVDRTVTPHKPRRILRTTVLTSL